MTTPGAEGFLAAPTLLSSGSLMGEVWPAGEGTGWTQIEVYDFYRIHSGYDSLRRKWKECRTEGQIYESREGESDYIPRIHWTFRPGSLEDTLGKTFTIPSTSQTRSL